LEREGSKLAIPGYVLTGLDPEVERLIFRFENARRRAYAMKQRGVDRLAILRRLDYEIGIPSRFVSTAYDMIKALPPHVTFGGKKAELLRMKGKTSAEEYRFQRNKILACRGEASLKGNVCLRIKDGKLRVTIGERRWIRLPIFIPKKYQRMLSEAGAYTILMKRRLDGRGYDVRIIVDAPQPEGRQEKRIMALDLNSGHVDFAVADKADLRPFLFGKVNCHKFLSARKGTKRIVAHTLVNKVSNIAKHYGAEVVVGKLRTSYIDSNHHFNRRVQGMDQSAIRKTMRYKLPLSGVGFAERSEVNTSKVAVSLANPLGLDVHKASAYAFAIKSVDFNRFQSLRDGMTSLEEFCADEGGGIPSMKRFKGRGLTVPHPSWMARLMCNELGIPLTPREATPKQGKGEGGYANLQSSILQVRV